MYDAYEYELNGDLLETTKPNPAFQIGDRVCAKVPSLVVDPDDFGTIVGWIAKHKMYDIQFDTVKGGPGMNIMGSVEHIMHRCECGNPKNGEGQGHSQWCKRFKKEF